MFVPRQIRKKGPKPTTPEIAGDKNVTSSDIAGNKENDNGEPKESAPQDRDQRKGNAPNPSGKENKERKGKERVSDPKESASPLRGPSGSSKRKREPSVQSSVRKPPAPSASTARRSPALPSSTVRKSPDPSSSTVPSDPRDLTLSDMLNDPFVQLGRYSDRDDTWHGPCYLYWFGSGPYPRFTHTLSMNLVQHDQFYRHDVGRTFLSRIVAHIGCTFDDVAWMTGHAYPSTIAVMFRHAADAQYVLATANIPKIGARRWNNPAMSRRYRGFTVQFNSRLALREAYEVAALSGEITDIRVNFERTGQTRRGETRYIVRYRTAASRIHAFENPRDGMSNLRAFNLDNKEINLTGDQPDVTGVGNPGEDSNSTVAAAVTLNGDHVVVTPLPDPPYRPWSIYDWMVTNVAEAWHRARTLREHGDVNVTAYRYARSRVLDVERVTSLSNPAVLEYDRYLAMNTLDQVRYDNENHRYR